MEAKELRIGNWYKGTVEFPGGSISAKINFNESKEFQLNLPEAKVIFTSYSNGMGGGSFDLLKFIDPIPLTDEWWINLGFHKEESMDCWYWCKTGNPNFPALRIIEIGVQNPSGLIILYVHLLQDLYIALTGSELIKIRKS